MLLINKGQAPVSLLAYKQQIAAYYGGLSNKDKDDIRNALLTEQGYICAYCMRRITQEDMTIEHYIPQSTNETLALDYRNMLGVCMGNRGNSGNKSRDMTCDAHRANTSLTVDPRDSSTIRKVKYKVDGTIYSDDASINNDLDVTLNLNCDAAGVFLKKNRGVALEAIIETLSRNKSEGQWPKNLLLKMKNGLNIAGKNTEYRGIMDFHIDKWIQRAKP